LRQRSVAQAWRRALGSGTRGQSIWKSMLRLRTEGAGRCCRSTLRQRVPERLTRRYSPVFAGCAASHGCVIGCAIFKPLCIGHDRLGIDAGATCVTGGTSVSPSMLLEEPGETRSPEGGGYTGNSPTYRARGRMSIPEAYCSMAWAIHPTDRPIRNRPSPEPGGNLSRMETSPKAKSMFG